jgi:hypothetical protein
MKKVSVLVEDNGERQIVRTFKSLPVLREKVNASHDVELPSVNAMRKKIKTHGVFYCEKSSDGKRTWPVKKFWVYRTDIERS